MKRKILVADKDSSLKEAFRVIFSEDQYEILYASNGKEAEKLADEHRPGIYIINVNLSKYNGIEVYKKLQKEKYLENARFFFLKDEDDRTELLGFQAEGVIEKPINFFKVHERLHKEGGQDKEEDVLELTDVIEEPVQPAGRPEPVSATVPEQRSAEQENLAAAQSAERSSIPRTEPEAPEQADLAQKPLVIAERNRTEEAIMEERPMFETNETTAGKGVAVEAANLELHVRTALGSIIQDAATKLVDAMTPAVSKYIEDYTRHVLFDIAEKVIREEIDKLLKESTDFPGKQI